MAVLMGAEMTRCSFGVFFSNLVAHGTKTRRARVLIFGTLRDTTCCIQINRKLTVWYRNTPLGGAKKRFMKNHKKFVKVWEIRKIPSIKFFTFII